MPVNDPIPNTCYGCGSQHFRMNCLILKQEEMFLLRRHKKFCKLGRNTRNYKHIPDNESVKIVLVFKGNSYNFI